MMKVLLVDDDHSLRLQIKARLEQLGYDVREARDGGQAFDLLFDDDLQVDAIITDMNMPHMSGAEILQAINFGVENTPSALLHSSETSGHMSDRSRIEDLAEFVKYFDFAQFHKKEHDLTYIDTFLRSVKK